MKNAIRCIRTKPYSKDYYLHQRLAQFAMWLDRTPDLPEIRSLPNKPAPSGLVEMVF